MKKSYVFIYNAELGSREEIRSFISNCAIIDTWRFELPQTFFIVSKNDSSDICARIREHFGEEKGGYLVIEYSESNAEGMMLERSWDLLSDKKLPPKE